MKRLGLLAAAGLAALVLNATPAAAAGLDPNQLFVCHATRADVADVSVADLRFGLAAGHAWAKATVNVTMRDGTLRAYTLSGRADPIDKPARPNNASAGFAYPGFRCIAQYHSIISVHNCATSERRRSCEIGVSVFGLPTVFAVSVTADPVRLLEAATTP